MAPIQRNICYSCSKGVTFGNNRSHSNTKVAVVRGKPNLQVARVLIEGKITKVKVCTRCLNAGKITRAPRGTAVA